jgi:hypothetical protein
LNVVEAVLDDVAANPALLTRQVAGKPALEAAVKSVLDGLAAQELDHFSGTTAAGILAGGVKAAIGRWEILTELPGDAGTGRLALQSVVDTVLAGVTGGDAQATWKLTEGRILVAIFDQSFAKLAEFGIDDESLAELTGALAAARTNLEEGGRFSVDLFARDLELRLAA